MKRLSWTLGLIALFFAATTVYFARALHVERAHSAAAVTAASPEAAAVPAETRARPAANAGASAVPGQSATSKAPAASSTAVSPDFPFAVTTSGSGSELTREQMKQKAIDDAKKFLADLATPEGRDRQMELQKRMMSSSRAGLADYLKLDPTQYSQFVDLLTQQDLAQRETATRCLLEQNCRYRGERADLTEAHNQEIAAVFGPDVVERYRFFERSYDQREAVSILRGRLPDSARLSDAKADALVRAWVEETGQISDDMRRVGYGIAVSNNIAYVVADADPDGKRAAAAEEYNRRWRERAATVLTPEQLAVFTQMQHAEQEKSRVFEEMRRASN